MHRELAAATPAKNRPKEAVVVKIQGTDVRDVRLRPARLERLRLNFPGLPMREGRFFVDVGMTTVDRDAELARADRALELTVFGSDAAGSGPIRLGGTWELPGLDGTGES